LRALTAETAPVIEQGATIAGKDIDLDGAIRNVGNLAYRGTPLS
jgi:hypothetical protein